MDYSTGVLNTVDFNFFAKLRNDLGPYFVDKSMLIENMVKHHCLMGHVDLVLRPRRCGKSTMLQMLNSFFSIPRNHDPEPRLLFEGLDIESRQDICTEHMGKYPVIFCDFKDLTGKSWEEMLSNFRSFVSVLYEKWEDCLFESLGPYDKPYFMSICNKTATEADLGWSLYYLTFYLAEKFSQEVIVLIDEYDAPYNHAYDHGYFDELNDFFGLGVLSRLLEANENLKNAVLVGVTPTIKKSAWFSVLNNIEIHALHTTNSPFAGMLMFTEFEVIRLKTLVKSELDLADLKARYNSYLASGNISVYNPVSVISALSKSKIENFWIATGEFPLLNRELPYGGLDVVEKLLTGTEIEFNRVNDVTYGSSTSSINAMLTFLYYAGYLTMTASEKYKIPNSEVMTDWATWFNRVVHRLNQISSHE